MTYLILFLALFFLLFLYMVLAKKMEIIDKPNERSSHITPTVRGGGIIFPLAIILWGVMFDHSMWFFIGAVLLMGVVGFLDDRYSLSQIPRLIVQSISVLFVLFEIGLIEQHIAQVLLAFILITGWLNTFNFMDGINGISNLYAGSILIGVYLFREAVSDVQLSLIYSVGLSLVVFGWFNVRKTALVFAGDVGSLSMGLILAFFVSKLILNTGRWEFIVFLSVYGVDSVMTILHRLKKKENIFEAHRTHLYQYLANEFGMNHILVALLYSLTQLAIIVGLFIMPLEYWTVYCSIILGLLSILYLSSKILILNKVRV